MRASITVRPLCLRALVLLSVLPTTDAAAVSLFGLKLHMDGVVAEPGPGDQLTYSVLLSKDEREITLELRAFHTPQGETNSSPVKGRGGHQDSHGNFVLRKVIRGDVDKDLSTVDESFTSPYASLDLPPGSLIIRYQFRGLDSDEVAFDASSEVSVITVNTGQRTRIRHLVSPVVQRGATAHVYQNGQTKEHAIEIVAYQPRDEIAPPEIVEVSIPGSYLRTRPSTAFSPKPFSAMSVPQATQMVYFATNRNLERPNKMTVDRYGDELAGLSYGVCTVHVPAWVRKKGRLNVGGRHGDAFYVQALRALSEAELFGSLQRSTEADVFLFVHGFNTTLEEAVAQTSQFVLDIEFAGQAMTFSWPSAGKTTSYGRDEEIAMKSNPSLEGVLLRLIEAVHDNQPNRRIHILAHSMGNRVLLQAVRNLRLRGSVKEGDKPFANTILVAPDVDLNVFGSLAATIIDHSARTTFYYSTKDLALKISEILHPITRAGVVPFFAEGMDTINADQANSPWIRMAHSYYASSDAALLDLSLLINHQQVPTQRRPPLTRETKLGFAHWNFRSVR